MAVDGRKRGVRRRRLREPSVIVFDATRAPTSATGAPTATSRTTACFTRGGESCRDRSTGRFRTRPVRATTIPTVRRRRSSASSTRCAFHMMASSTCATGRTTEFRSSGRTAPSSRKVSSPSTHSEAAPCGTSRSHTDPDQQLRYRQRRDEPAGLRARPHSRSKSCSTFGGAGHWAGQFYGAHNLAVNGRGDLFITETYEGKRVQKFRYSRRPIVQWAVSPK